MIAFLRRLFGHRHVHRWTMHSFAANTIAGYHTFYRASACLQCECGARVYVTRGDLKQPFESRDEALVWLRSLCASPVPNSLPEQLDDLSAPRARS